MSGDLTEQRLDVLGKADVIVLDEIQTAGLYKETWQASGGRPPKA